MIDGAFALAFLSGVVATVNPCGFAMLPAYLSYFLGIESHAAVDEPAQASLRRALLVSASVSAGFLAVFTVLGFVIRAGGDGVADVIRYLSIVIGFLLIGLGIAFLLGRTLTFATPKLDRGGRTRTAWSMFVFGISYAIASFGCTIGPFVLTVLGSFTRDGTLSGVLMIVAYGLGMGLLLTTLTVTLALARGGLLRGLRSAMRRIDRVAGVLLILAGLYLVYYWWYDLVSDTGAKQVAGGGVSAWFQSQADRVAGWLNDRGAGPLALVLGIVTVAAIAAVLARRPKAPQPRTVRPGDGAALATAETPASDVR
ncbi:MAG TPA: cytochrome c biogenesis protein CcdA [Acidimicrobiales bacterium]